MTDADSPTSDLKPLPAQPVADSSNPARDRSELYSRARSFLLSPQVIHQDVPAKRRFLVEKGLTDEEIDRLLLEAPPPIPQIPPRTYPQPPPSNLPSVLLGVVRLFSWMAGGSSVLIVLYHQLILPRLARSYQARQSIKLHQGHLLRKFSTGLSSFKESQSESFAVLPRPLPTFEDPRHGQCHTIDELLATCDNPPNPEDISDISILRCAIEQLSAENEARRPTTEELFKLMFSKLPWFSSSAGPKYQGNMWQTLTSSSLFESEETPDTPTTLWTYVPPKPVKLPPPPLLSSLFALKASLPGARPDEKLFQHTLQALSDFTGYITMGSYTVSTPNSMRIHGAMSVVLSPQEEEVRREIRALKGLVLNRRSFMPRAGTVPWLEAAARAGAV